LKTEVFIRAEKKFKAVKITSSDKPEISDGFLNKWIVDIIKISAGLIIKECFYVKRYYGDN
jgi:hypothetical protein